MRVIRLSTSMLLVVIFALALGLLVQHRRAERRIAEAERRLAELHAANPSGWLLISERRIAKREIERLRRQIEEMGGEINSPGAARRDRGRISANIVR